MTALAQLLLYLGLAFGVYGLLVNLTRRLALPDFLAALTAGVLLGLFGAGLGETSTYEIARIFHDPASLARIDLVAQAGLVLFLIHLGLHMDAGYLRTNTTVPVRQSLLVIAVDVLVVGGLSYWSIAGGNVWAALLITAVMLSRHVGGALKAFAAPAPEMKRSLTDLAQTAVIVDGVALLVVTILHAAAFYRDYALQSLSRDFINWLILIPFVVAILRPRLMQVLGGMIPEGLRRYSLPLGVGLICLFIYAGVAVGTSLLLPGVLAGYLIKQFGERPARVLREQLLAGTGFLYSLPFIEVGRSLAASGHLASMDGRPVLLILIAFAVTALLTGLSLLRRSGYALPFLLGTFARGELAVLMVWVMLGAGALTAATGVALIAAAVSSSILAVAAGAIVKYRRGSDSARSTT